MPNVTGDQPSEAADGNARSVEGSERPLTGSTPAPSSFPRWLRYPILLPREGF